MATDNFKYVIGAAEAGKPAVMRLYGPINEHTTRCFNDEFLWLQDYVKPSKIVISINSEGGSVLYGMGTYSIIQNSPIETETVIEGLAASMGSVIWAAGTRSLMKDYSILMIHNPFLQSDKCKTQNKCGTEDKCKTSDKCGTDDKCKTDNKCNPEDGCKVKDSCKYKDSCDPKNGCRLKDECKEKEGCDKCKTKCALSQAAAKDENGNSAMLEAFRKQIETVYVKRFGLSRDKVREIMEGQGGCDGTYFDAQEAVKAGIIPAENVIRTSKQIRTKVKNRIEGLSAAADIQAVMASVNTELEDFKPSVNEQTIPYQNQTDNTNTQEKMEKEQEFAFGSVCSQLGMGKASEISAVVNRITELMNAEKQVKEMQASLDALKIQKEGLDAQLANVNNELDSVKKELKEYKDAEQAQRAAEIEQFVDSAISDGKINAESKAKWIEMANTNFEMVQDTLNSIEKRDKISEEIAKDPANTQNALEGLTEAERRMKEAVAAVVGDDFQFKTLD
jgi:ATP-dependent protease ClpP protease subunit